MLGSGKSIELTGAQLTAAAAAGGAAVRPSAVTPAEAAPSAATRTASTRTMTPRAPRPRVTTRKEAPRRGKGEDGTTSFLAALRLGFAPTIVPLDDFRKREADVRTTPLPSRF